MLAVSVRKRIHPLTSLVRSNKDLAPVAGVVAFALLVRLAFLDVVPPNITADEADNLQFALRVLEGKDPALFGLDWKPAPAFSVHLLAWFARIFAPSVVGLRMPSVLLSALTLVPFYFLARQHTKRVSAVAAALLLAASPWFLHFSRSGWENVQVAFYGAMAAWMLSLALRRERNAFYFYAATGFFAALGLYGYFAGRLIVVALVVFLPFALWFHRDQTRQILLGYALLGTVCLVTFAPQLRTTLDNRDAFTARTQVVSIFNAQLPYEGVNSSFDLLRLQISKTIRAFAFLDGAVLNAPRYAPVGRPVFDPLTAVAYVGGLLFGLLYWRRYTLWWLMLLVPLVATQVFSAGTPDMARAVGVAPFMYLFVALGLDVLLRARPTRFGVVQVAVLAAVPVACLMNLGFYFAWMAEPAVAQARQPAVQTADLPRWVEAQLAEIRAGRRGLNVGEWQALSGTVPATPVPQRPSILLRQIRPLPTELLQLPLNLDRVYGGLASPRGVAVAANGDVFVADTGNRRVLHLDRDGRVLGMMAANLVEPSDLALTPAGELLVLDPQADAILVFGADGAFRRALGPGLGMYRPRGIAVDANGLIYVADTGRDRVLVLEPGGKVARSVERGQTDLFRQPSDVAVDREGNIYVADPTAGRVLKLDPAGNYFFEWPISQANTVESPHLAFTPDDRLLVTDPQVGRLLCFATTGEVLGAWSVGDENRLQLPVGIAVSYADGVIYVVDTGGATVKSFVWQK
ncbi:MAG: glycosyltransferase family 39 protein [Chloroflexota bacterium]